MSDWKWVEQDGIRFKQGPRRPLYRQKQGESMPTKLDTDFVKATVTMSLEDYEQMKHSLKMYREDADKFERNLKTVCGLDIETLNARAGEIEDSKSRQALHAARMRGEL